jgi:hypothetical protein
MKIVLGIFIQFFIISDVHFNRTLLIGIVAGVIVSSALIFTSNFTIADAQTSGSSMMGGMGGMMGDMGGMMGGSAHNVPGSIHQMCQQAGMMPPHYCEPSYTVMSSVKGLRISNVDVQNDNTAVVTIMQIGTAAGAMNQKIVVVGGTGHLAGATIVDGGWSGTTTVTIPFEGFGTLYDFGDLHLHIFPVTSG